VSTAEYARLLTVPTGFTGPEAVRYDADQDIYFVSNFGRGSSSAEDNNGFISRMHPDGTLEKLDFIAGGVAGVILHAPRGMTIVGDSLWVADADAVRVFHRRTGLPLATARFTDFDIGFLNDVAPGPDGVYVTDTGMNRIYRIAGGAVSLALADSGLGSPNGITWDRNSGRFIVVPFGGATAIRAWRPGSSMITDVGRSGGAMFDGVEVLADGRILVASQADSSLHLFTQGRGRAILRTAGRPADIAVDTKRNRVAVPFIALNRIEIWQLPPE
jgi:sugar lactone lactonase YvrE